MIHFVLAAFTAAGGANFSAQGANSFRVLTASCHCSRCEGADASAVHVKRDAGRHAFHVLLMQAGGRAVVAGYCAGVAGFDAGIKFVVGHFGLPIREA